MLLHQDMPTGAMVAALLWGLGAWALGLGPLTYLSGLARNGKVAE